MFGGFWKCGPPSSINVMQEFIWGKKKITQVLPRATESETLGDGTLNSVNKLCMVSSCSLKLENHWFIEPYYYSKTSGMKGFSLNGRNLSSRLDHTSCQLCERDPSVPVP